MAAITESTVKDAGIRLTPDDVSALFADPATAAPTAGLVADLHDPQPRRVLDALGAIVERNAADDKLASNARVSLSANLSNTIAGTFVTAGIATPIIAALARGAPVADLYPFIKPFAVCALTGLSIHLLGRWSLAGLRS